MGIVVSAKLNDGKADDAYILSMLSGVDNKSEVIRLALLSYCEWLESSEYKPQPPKGWGVSHLEATIAEAVTKALSGLKVVSGKPSPLEEKVQGGVKNAAKAKQMFDLKAGSTRSW